MYEEEDQQANEKLPIARNEDVEFSAEVADEDDREAMQRAEDADQRAEQSNEL
jgi:hypothetical protein